MAMLFGAWPFLVAQVSPDSIPEEKVRQIMNVLAGDSLQGRGNGSPDLLKAGRFIITQFTEAGLQPLPGSPGLFHSFLPFGGPKESRRDQLQWNGKAVSSKDFLYLPLAPGKYDPRPLTDFKIVQVEAFSNDIFLRYDSIQEDVLIWARPPVKDRFKTEELIMPEDGLKNARLLVYAEQAPDSLLLTSNESYYGSVEYNIVGYLSGRSKANECIVFSAHYDHEGVVSGKKKDRIMNGANDNASGTAALLMLAQYYAQRKDNERTLIFCAFAGEELGLKGSTEFAKAMKPERIKAGINLEMLGVSQYGKKKIFITGQRYSDLPDILGKELTAQGLKVIREPDESKQLFMRSDNYPFVKKGVSFHTIMASDDDDPCYHKPCDEIKRIDIPNLTFIIRAIAAGSRSLISGERTPGGVSKLE
jgi:hypothetical protein